MRVGVSLPPMSANPNNPPYPSELPLAPPMVRYDRYRRKTVLPLLLFLATCLSTFFVGASKWSPIGPIGNSFVGHTWRDLLDIGSWDFFDIRILMLANWDTGLAYMFFVILIIWLHEMGHFVATLIYRVPASYPFFLPLPINPIGTMGAVIAMHGHTADRKQIFDIGLAGPIAGLVAAIPIAWFGVAQLDLTTQAFGGIGFRLPLLMGWFAQWSEVPGYQVGDVVWLSQLNPMFVAGWVGMLITGLNMMPVGQLDGGHVTYTLFGKAAHWIAKGTMLFAIAFMVYYQTLMMILMVVLLLLIGTEHPPTRDDNVPIGWFRWTIGLASLAIPVFCFPPRIFAIQ